MPRPCRNNHTIPRPAARRAAAKQCCCLLLLGLLLGPHANAEGQDPVRYVVFDPVPLDPALLVENEDKGGDPTLRLDAIPVLKSGSPVASDKTPIDLLTWIAAQTPVQNIDPKQLQATIDQYEKSIADLEQKDGPYANDLSQQLLSLADAYRQAGDFGKSLELYNRAAFVTRINKGLFSAEQIPIVQHIIDDKVSMGDVIAADEEEEYLFYLQQKLHGDDPAAMLPALKSYAEWNVFAFSSRLLPSPSQDSDGKSSSSAVVTPLEEQDFRLRRLIYAQNIYWSIVQILRSNFGINDPRLQDAEINLALTNYFYATSVSIPDDAFTASAMLNTNPTQNILDRPALSINDMGYKHGREALERRISYLSHAQNQDNDARIRATVDLSDWMIFFRKQRAKGLDRYQDTYDKARDELPQQALEQIFSPPYPKLIPDFITPYNSRRAMGIPDDQPLVYKGYIDARLTLNTFGKPTDVDILDMSEGTQDAIATRLYRNLRNSQFRPRFQHGEIPRNDVVIARYYYAY